MRAKRQYVNDWLRKFRISRTQITSNDNTSKSYTFADVFKFAASYWFKQPKLLTLILVLQLFAAIFETLQPSALAAFLGAMKENNTHDVVLFKLIIFLLDYVGVIVCIHTAYFIYKSFEARLFKKLVDDVFVHIYRLPTFYFNDTLTGSIVSKVIRARQKLEIFEDIILLRIYSAGLILIWSLIFLSFKFPTLAALLFLYLVFLICISAYLVMRISGPAQGLYTTAQDRFSANLADSIGGITIAKAYACEDDEIHRFKSITEDLYQSNLSAYYLGTLTGFLQKLFLTGMLVIMLGGGMWYYFQGKMTVESMAYLTFAYTIMQSYFRSISENIKSLLTAAYDLHGVIGLLHEKSEVKPQSALPIINIKAGSILFDNITFIYPGKTKPIFKNLSIAIRPGEQIALVGPSGGGKTSFIRLIQNLYPLQAGKILIDGHDIAQHSLQSLRSKIALVAQDPILFHRSIRENIAYAKPSATDREISFAARQARIEEFILSLPLQYETLVGENGIKLSGGERQRVAIARAILADRPILILDEATSSLDSISERSIQEALHVLTKGRTSIIIAHRLSTIKEVDRILVFEHGRIIEEGSHDYLINNNSVYATLCNLQHGIY